MTDRFRNVGRESVTDGIPAPLFTRETDAGYFGVLMSYENVEALRQIVAAFRARDWSRIRELVDPNFEYHTSDQFPEGGETYRGPDAMMQGLDVQRPPPGQRAYLRLPT